MPWHAAEVRAGHVDVFGVPGGDRSSGHHEDSGHSGYRSQRSHRSARLSPDAASPGKRHAQHLWVQEAQGSLGRTSSHGAWSWRRPKPKHVAQAWPPPLLAPLLALHVGLTWSPRRHARWPASLAQTPGMHQRCSIISAHVQIIFTVLCALAAAGMCALDARTHVVRRFATVPLSTWLIIAACVLPTARVCDKCVDVLVRALELLLWRFEHIHYVLMGTSRGLRCATLRNVILLDGLVGTHARVCARCHCVVIASLM
jgi:hypothetical protein